MLYAGSDLDKAREAAIKHRPRIRLTIRQRTRLLGECRRHKTRNARGEVEHGVTMMC
jgi:hypothetical protein